jgi:hypothetical protein
MSSEANPVVDAGVPGGPLKRRIHSGDPEDTRNGQAFLEWCPVCGPDGPRFEGQGRFAWHLYSEHGPEDFGLSPIGDRD